MVRDIERKRRRENAFQRKWYKENKGKLCVYCRKPWRGPRTYCNRCAARVNPVHADRERERRKRLVAQGLCIKCGEALHKEMDWNPRTEALMVTCFPCRDRNRKFKEG